MSGQNASKPDTKGKPKTSPAGAAPSRSPDTGDSLRRLLSGGFFGGTEAQFERLGRIFQRGMAPRDVVERMHVDLVLIAIFQIRQAVWALPDAAPGDPAICRALTNGHRLLMKHLDALEKSAEKDPRPGAEGLRPDELVPERDPEEGRETVDPLAWEEVRPAEADPDWRARIDLDGPPGGDGPLRGPVVRGTALSARNVVGMLADGWSPRQVLAVYPQLRMADLKACVACHQEGLSGPASPGP